MLARLAGLRSAKKARRLGWPALRKAVASRRRKAELRRRLGLISDSYAKRLRAKGVPVGDLSGLVARFGYSEGLMHRLMFGDLSYLLPLPRSPVEPRTAVVVPSSEPPRTSLRGLPLRGTFYRRFAAGTRRGF